MRIVRTEGHGIQIRAAVDMQEQAKKAGADVVKQWDATLDARTRESHARLDGEIRELHEEFSNGMKYPSDPAGGASEVINCRCALLQRARWALDEEELEVLRDRASCLGKLSVDSKAFGHEKEKEFSRFMKNYLNLPKDVDYSAKSSKMLEKGFRTTDDPMREVTGAGLISNPEEIARMISAMEAEGVEIEYRADAMGYSPNVQKGFAGKFIIDEEASFSAWMHEYTHFLDDKKDGYLGMRVFANTEKCIYREEHAYNVEIELAKAANRPDIVERLEALKRKEVARYGIITE